MSLDMIGLGNLGLEPHYRRYLRSDNRIGIICVQSFDYHDYDAARFVDLQLFDTREEAEFTLITTDDVISVAEETPEDPVVTGQAQRLIRIINEHGGYVAGRS